MTNPAGRFGVHGGQYIPETLMNAVIELEQAYNRFKEDPEIATGSACSADYLRSGYDRGHLAPAADMAFS